MLIGASARLIKLMKSRANRFGVPGVTGEEEEDKAERKRKGAVGILREEYSCAIAKGNLGAECREVGFAIDMEETRPW